MEDKEREWDLERNKLESKVLDMEAELASVLEQLQKLLDAKMGLELEIAAYRKLLEGEENRSVTKSISKSDYH